MTKPTEDEDFNNFMEWVTDNLPAWILTKDSMDELVSKAQHFQISPTIILVSLKLMLLSVEDLMRRSAVSEKEFELAMEEVERMIAVVGKRGLKLKEMLDDMIKKAISKEDEAQKAYR